ncbi:MAG TPA: ATP-binding protein, partial [Opitutus sp.]|nr:ATP-binding protein [Opitutus sp.]
KNAVKFTPAGGEVSVRSRLEAPGRVCVEITDTGIGITTGELARVFEAFSQGDHASGSGSHRFGGLGLGLAISRRVIELHGGRIEAESAGRDRGATFRVELPVETVVAGRTEHAHDLRADPAPAGAAGPAGESPAILLVEDHGPTRQAIERLLLRRNYRVRAAATAAEARALGREETFALLISDIGLPDGSGYDLMSEFGARGVRGIALTGYGMEEDVSRSRRAGFDVHLTKPVRMEALDRALASLLGEGSRV